MGNPNPTAPLKKSGIYSLHYRSQIQKKSFHFSTRKHTKAIAVQFISLTINILFSEVRWPFEYFFSSLHGSPLTFTPNIGDWSLTSTVGRINGQYPTWLSVKRSSAWSATEVAGFDRICLVGFFFLNQQHPVWRLFSIYFRNIFVHGTGFVRSQFTTRTSKAKKKLMKAVRCRFQWMDEGLPWWHAAAADKEKSDMPA